MLVRIVRTATRDHFNAGGYITACKIESGLVNSTATAAASCYSYSYIAVTA
jgi:hypothetical protein